ncbi:MAG: glycosyltransferase [Actinomycetota bacterium]
MIVPTTGDRGPLLEYSVGSVLRQQMENFEVFIVGDGVNAETQRAAEKICSADERVHFVAHAKHERRGEIYRDEIIRLRARGQIIAYLSDRDLWFSDHLAEVATLLNTVDLAMTMPVRFGDDDVDRTVPHRDPAAIAALPTWRRPNHISPLSATAHTVEAYRRLPVGWSTTPAHLATDSYMWHRFLSLPNIAAARAPVPTVIYLKRGNHPGLPTSQRRDLMRSWTDRLTATGGEEAIRRAVAGRLLDERVELEARTAGRRLRLGFLQPARNALRARGIMRSAK